eukprot:scaffold12024_cov22-Tisochrysis_lutea.AAC.3
MQCLPMLASHAPSMLAMQCLHTTKNCFVCIPYRESHAPAPQAQQRASDSRVPLCLSSQAAAVKVMNQRCLAWHLHFNSFDTSISNPKAGQDPAFLGCSP